MKLFECQNCGQLLYFENTKCESCGMRLGYLPAREAVTALKALGDPPGRPQRFRAMAEPRAQYRFCANAEHNVCNWLVRADSPNLFCEACQHNRTIPDLSIAEIGRAHV